MASDILSLADALVTDIQNRSTPIYADTVVSRQYEMTYDLGTFEKRRIDIYPFKYSTVKDTSREDSEYEFQYSLVVMERYKNKGNVNKQWIDDLILFVKDQIFNPFDNPDPYMIVDGGVRYWVADVDVTTLYDFDFLKQHRVFWSEIEVSFRRITQSL